MAKKKEAEVYVTRIVKLTWWEGDEEGNFYLNTNCPTNTLENYISDLKELFPESYDTESLMTVLIENDFVADEVKFEEVEF